MGVWWAIRPASTSQTVSAPELSVAAASQCPSAESTSPVMCPVRIRRAEDSRAWIFEPGRPEYPPARDEVPDRYGALIVPDRNPRPVAAEPAEPIEPDSLALGLDANERTGRLTGPGVPGPGQFPAEHDESRAVVAEQDHVDRLWWLTGRVAAAQAAVPNSAGPGPPYSTNSRGPG